MGADPVGCPTNWSKNESVGLGSRFGTPFTAKPICSRWATRDRASSAYQEVPANVPDQMTTLSDMFACNELFSPEDMVCAARHITNRDWVTYMQDY